MYIHNIQIYNSHWHNRYIYIYIFQMQFSGRGSGCSILWASAFEDSCFWDERSWAGTVSSPTRLQKMQEINVGKILPKPAIWEWFIPAKLWRCQGDGWLLSYSNYKKLENIARSVIYPFWCVSLILARWLKLAMFVVEIQRLMISYLALSQVFM